MTFRPKFESAQSLSDLHPEMDTHVRHLLSEIVARFGSEFGSYDTDIRKAQVVITLDFTHHLDTGRTDLGIKFKSKMPGVRNLDSELRVIDGELLVELDDAHRQSRIPFTPTVHRTTDTPE